MKLTDTSALGIGSWLAIRGEKSSGKVAIRFEGTDVTYGALATRVAKLANGLTDLGVVKGDRVAYLGDNHPSFIESLFASALIGAIFVPLNTRLVAGELGYQLSDSSSSLLIYSSALEGTAIESSEEAGVAIRIRVEGAFESDSQATHTLEDVIETSSPEPLRNAVVLTDPAMILYTSGTSGRPKGALITHDNLVGNCLNVLIDYDLVSTDIALMVSPLFHVASLGMGALPSILKGATILLERRFDPGRALRLIESNRVTWLSGVPTTFQLLCESANWPSTDLSSIRQLTCGGSPVPLRVIAAFEDRGLSFTGGYGMTEACPGVTSLQPDASRRKHGSAGLAHFFTEVRIDRADKQGIGEIQIVGRNVIAGYWNRDSAECFTNDGWFKTGDLGYLDEDGYLFVSDRLKDMVISGGENIYPAEVELIIAEMPDVESVAVIGAPNETWGEVPIAILKVTQGSNVAAADVAAFLSGRIAKYKIPKQVFLVDDLPRTASGKIMKSRLRELFADRGTETKEPT